MKLLRITGIILFFSILSASSSFASEKEGGWTLKVEQTPHPPHDHSDHDHLKYIRGHGTDRKKKKIAKLYQRD